MNSVIRETDYRRGISDKYGRAICGGCGRRRKINARWDNPLRVLCKPCSYKLFGIARPKSEAGGDDV